MSNMQEPPTRVQGFSDLWTTRRGNLSCIAVGLRAGGVCLYSPVEKTSSRFEEMAPVKFLFAPNHYHNKAIAEFTEAYPDAGLVSGELARSRLEKITSREFQGLDVLKAALPENASFLEPDGLKTGEIWLRVEGEAGVAWVVTDAFCGLDSGDNESGALGFLKTFPKYGIQNADRFSAWVRERVEEDAPTLVVPCHGNAVRGGDLKSDIAALLDQL
jgi:hypothetical protein